MANTYRFGPGYILVADSISDPADQWTDLGYTRGITVDATNADVSFGRVDQNGIPTTDAIWVAPRGFEIRASLLDKDAAKVVKSLPGAVRVTSGAKEAVTLPSTPATVSTQAVAIIPHDEYTSGDPWVDANNAIWLKEAYLTLDTVPAGREVGDDDDAISGLELRITRAMPNAAGIGSPVVGAPEVNPQGVQFAWQPLYDGLVPKVRDSYTFSRASTATYTDANGVVQTAGVDVARYDATTGRPINEPQRTNYCIRSQDGSSWSEVTSATITADSETAPDGTQTAFTVAWGASGSTARLYNLGNSSGDVSISCFIKKTTGATSFPRIQFGNTVKFYVDTNTGQVNQDATSTGYAQGSVSVGDWWWVWGSGDGALGDGTEDILLYPSSTQDLKTYSSISGPDLVVWGFQVESADYPTSYIPTTGTAATRSADVWGGAGTFTRASTATYVRGGVVKYAGTDEPRIQDSGLLLEPQRTNVNSYGIITDAIWAKDQTTITDNAGTAPDGTLTAASIVENGATAEHYIRGASFAKAASAIQYTISCFAKANGRDWAQLILFYGGTGCRAWFDLANGVVGSTAFIGAGWSSPSVQIEEVGNGWYRCSLTVTSDTQTSCAHHVAGSPSDGTYNFAGSSSDAILVWGAQVEAGSYPTSYIPTSGSSVTRSQDYLDFPFSTVYSAASGLSMEVAYKAARDKDTQSDARTLQVGSWNGGGSRNTIIYYEDASTTIRLYSRDWDDGSAESTQFALDYSRGDTVESGFSMTGDEDSGSVTPYWQGAAQTAITQAFKDGQLAADNSKIVFQEASGVHAWEPTSAVVTTGVLTPAQIRKYLR